MKNFFRTDKKKIKFVLLSLEGADDCRSFVRHCRSKSNSNFARIGAWGYITKKEGKETGKTLHVSRTTRRVFWRSAMGIEKETEAASKNRYTTHFDERNSGKKKEKFSFFLSFHHWQRQLQIFNSDYVGAITQSDSRSNYPDHVQAAPTQQLIY